MIAAGVEHYTGFSPSVTSDPTWYAVRVGSGGRRGGDVYVTEG